jgi:hypothetical protein
MYKGSLLQFCGAGTEASCSGITSVEPEVKPEQ